MSASKGELGHAEKGDLYPDPRRNDDDEDFTTRYALKKVVCSGIAVADTVTPGEFYSPATSTPSPRESMKKTQEIGPFPFYSGIDTDFLIFDVLTKLSQQIYASRQP